VETTVVIAAPLDRVWAALTTGPGLEAWMTGRAKVDLRVGGEVLTRYGKDGPFPDAQTIAHTITALDPRHVLVWKPKRAPSNFPFKAAWLKTTTFLTFSAEPDGKTRLTERMLGFDATPESQKMRAFFVEGNRESLEALQRQFAPSDAGTAR
jgi:uncharacterized protein YndB with AHSA1/START domain